MYIWKYTEEIWNKILENFSKEYSVKFNVLSFFMWIPL